MTRPRKGAMRLPTAVKDRDALICDRFHPKVSSRGSMNRPNPYCPAPTDSALAKKGAEITHQPRYIFGGRSLSVIRIDVEYMANRQGTHGLFRLEFDLSLAVDFKRYCGIYRASVD
jgi:hypothetical protein